MIELSRVQPIALEGGFSSVRVWVNDTFSGPVYFDDYDNNKFLFEDLNDYSIDLCGHFNLPGRELDPSQNSTLDITNFKWLKGSRHIFTNRTSIIFESQLY